MVPADKSVIGKCTGKMSGGNVHSLISVMEEVCGVLGEVTKVGVQGSSITYSSVLFAGPAEEPGYKIHHDTVGGLLH